MKNPKSILITGASSGIGEALATLYADHGITLFLSGRNEARLSAIKETCEDNGAEVYSKKIDVRNEDEMKQWVDECDTVASLDLVIANAGISSGKDAIIKDVFATNVHGVFHTVEPSIKLMKVSGRGQIAIVSSIAGYRGMASSPTYSTSKVTVKAYGEALRGQYHQNNIEVNVICPGYVKSRITDKNDFSMPFFMSADKAAKIIKDGLARNKARITFPWQMKLIIEAGTRILPEFIQDRIFRLLPKK